MSRLHQLVVVHLGLLLVVCIIDVRGMLTSQPHNLVVPKGTVFNVSCVTNSESGAAIAVAFDFNSPVACSTANGGTNPTFGPSGANECDFRFTSIDTGDATVVQCNDDQLIAQGADIIVYTVEQCNVTSDVVQGQNATLVCDMTFYKFPHPGSRFNIPTIEWSNLPNSKVSDTFTPSGYQPVARRMTTTTSVLVQGTTFPNYNCTANFIFQGAANPTYPTTYDTTQVTATICQTPALPVKMTGTTPSGNSTTTSGLSRASLLALILIPTLMALLALGLGLWALYYWCFLANADRKKGEKPKQTSEPQQPLYYHPQGIWNPYTAQPPWGDAPRSIPPLRAPLFGGRRARAVTQPLSYIEPGPPVQFLKMKELPKLQVPWSQSSSGSQFNQFFQPGIYKPRFPGQPYGI